MHSESTTLTRELERERPRQSRRGAPVPRGSREDFLEVLGRVRRRLALHAPHGKEQGEAGPFCVLGPPARFAPRLDVLDEAQNLSLNGLGQCAEVVQYLLSHAHVGIPCEGVRWGRKRSNES